MKKLISILLAVSAILGAVMLTGCRGTGHHSTVDIYTPVPEVTSVVRPVPTDVPDFTPAPTEEPTAVPTESSATATPLPTGTEPDQSVFDDAAFVGNSIFEGLYRFGIITHGDFFTKVGLNVNTVYTDTTATGTVPIIDELSAKDYGKVYLLLGQNELGWPSYTTFIQKYSDLLDAVWERQPGARIFIVALPPVTKEYSDGSTNGVNISNITRMNGMLEDLAQRRGATFIEIPDELYDSAGYLPDDASSDGIHLNLKYDRIWADHICLRTMGVK
ncbi:MAG: hypothetical protein J5772_04240 [Clostridia bacterium]|nr:hypothetical protein [Clostridia bacterium]